MDQRGPKHVKLPYVMNKTQSLKNYVYLVELHIYYKMIHGPYNIKLQAVFCDSLQWSVTHISGLFYNINTCFKNVLLNF